MKIFLYDAGKDKEINDQDVELTDALHEFQILSRDHGSFYGIKSSPVIIQFAWEEADNWLVDIPFDMSKGIALQKHATTAACVEIIIQIFSGIKPTQVEGLKEVKIM